MTKTLYSLLAAGAMLAVATAAQAQGPVQLSDVQLDNVTAGATAIGSGFGGAGGSILAGTSVTINTAVHGHGAFAFGDIASIAASAHHGPSAFASSTLSLGVTSP